MRGILARGRDPSSHRRMPVQEMVTQAILPSANSTRCHPSRQKTQRSGTTLSTSEDQAYINRNSASSSFALATIHRPKGRPLYRSCPSGTVAMGYPAAAAWTQSEQSAGAAMTFSPWVLNASSRMFRATVRRPVLSFSMCEAVSALLRALMRSSCLVCAAGVFLVLPVSGGC